MKDWISRAMRSVKPIGTAIRNQTMETRRPWLTDPNFQDTVTVSKDQ
jgi:chorismate-pyruvate lyase